VPRFHFTPSARLQRFLGRELIADANLAIMEFVKNAYDAGASEVHVEFLLKDREKTEQVITISDNGTGMTEEEFRESWMRPGFSHKGEAQGNIRKSAGRITTAEARARQRAPLGEKGLGRLASGRLGQLMHVYTRKSRRSPWLHVFFDWAQFEDMYKDLHKVPIPYDYDSEPVDGRFVTGTVVEIETLSLNWAGRVPGRKVAGRPDYRIGRLRQDLALLVQPLGPVNVDFRIFLGSDAQELNQYHGEVSPATPEFFDYKYEFRFEVDDDGAVTVVRELHRSAEMATKVGQEQATVERRALEDLSREFDPENVEARPSTLRCGGFRGRFFYYPESERRFREAYPVPAGVFLYRDGARVDPYGHHGDDWLGARARKASRQGYAAIQPNLLVGYVEVSRDENPDLIDMSNRQGLVENDAYDDFLAQARAEFAHFDKLVFEEYVKPNWETIEEKEQERAQTTVGYNLAMLRAIVHSLRQPLAGLGLDLSVLESLAESTAIPADLRGKLQEALVRARGHLGTMEEVIKKFFSLPSEPEVMLADIRGMVDAAVLRVKPLAASVGASASIRESPDGQVPADPHVLVEVLAELMGNALEATRPPKRKPTASIGWELGDGHVLIDIIDNGGGISDEVRSALFVGGVSTKGRPGVGLLLARMLVASMQGTVSVSRTGEDGSVIRVRLPLSPRARKR
jgi:signal transduction histidine kinase